MTEHVIDTWFVISVGVAFLAGLLSLFAFFWLRTISREANLKGKSGEMTGIERLEHYERQIIDMKIRLDALEMMEQQHGSKKNTEEESVPQGLLTGLAQLLTQASENAPLVIKEQDKEKERDIDVISSVSQSKDEPKKSNFVPKTELVVYSNPIDHVLHLITNDITTSRDIQITMKKSREHTSRLLKKMYEEGYLLRNKENRPYTYSITAKGEERLKHSETAD